MHQCLLLWNSFFPFNCNDFINDDDMVSPSTNRELQQAFDLLNRMGLFREHGDKTRKADSLENKVICDIIKKKKYLIG